MTKTASITFDEFIKGVPFTIIENNDYEFYKLEEYGERKLMVVKFTHMNRTDVPTDHHANVDTITKTKTVKLFACGLLQVLQRVTLKFKANEKESA